MTFHCREKKKISNESLFVHLRRSTATWGLLIRIWHLFLFLCFVFGCELCVNRLSKPWKKHLSTDETQKLHGYYYCSVALPSSGVVHKLLLQVPVFSVVSLPQRKTLIPEGKNNSKALTSLKNDSWHKKKLFIWWYCELLEAKEAWWIRRDSEPGMDAETNGITLLSV